VQAACADGTPSGFCSVTKPQMCMAGALVDNATMCGCPPGKIISVNGIFCEFSPCMDGNVSVPDGTCSANMQKKCVNGVLVDKATECGCPSGTIQQGELCITQTAETISSCGTLGTVNTIYMLDQNVNTAGTCFTITAENVTLDCNGYSITGNNASNTYGVNSNIKPGAKLMNCIISNFYTAVYFNGAGNGTIQNVTASGVSEGINLKSSLNNTIAQSTATGSIGILINSNSNGNLISNTTGTQAGGCSTSTCAGIQFGGSSFNRIIGSTGTSVNYHGIRFGGGNNNTVENSTAISSSSYGI